MFAQSGLRQQAPGPVLVFRQHHDAARQNTNGAFQYAHVNIENGCRQAFLLKQVNNV